MTLPPAPAPWPPPPPPPRKRRWIPAVAVGGAALLATIVVVLQSGGHGDSGDGPVVHHAELVTASGDGTQVAVQLDVYRGRRMSKPVCGSPADRSLVIPVRLSVENRSSFTAPGSAGLGVLIQDVAMTAWPRCLGVESATFGNLAPGERKGTRYLLVVQNYYSPAEPGGSPGAAAATVFVSGPLGYQVVSSSGGDRASTSLGTPSFYVSLAPALP